MNRNLLYILLMVVVFFTAAGVISYRHFENVDGRHEEQLDLARVQREYYERVGLLRSNPDEKAYRDEVNGFFHWYFTEVDQHVARFHQNREFTDYLAELDHSSGKELEKSARGQFGQQLSAAIDKKSATVAERRAFFDVEKKLFDTFRSGHYQPVYTATDKGMRLDVVSDDVTMADGKPRVRVSVVIWGAPRELVQAEGVKRMHTDLSISSNWKLFDAKNKLYGEVNVSNLGMRNDFPERLIAVFPPQMVLGHYDMELVPSNVDHMEITFNVNARSPTGGAADASYVWKLPTPAEWKLRPGETWEGATEQVRSQEEIDPAAAAKKQARK